MTNEEAHRWLDQEWAIALERQSPPDPEIDSLADSRVVSIRYALVTQLLGTSPDPYVNNPSRRHGLTDHLSQVRNRSEREPPIELLEPLEIGPRANVRTALRQVLSDAATGTPGDIMCYKQEVLSLVVEVKDTELTLTQAEASSFKAKQSRQDLSNLLFIVPRLSQKDLHAIEALVNTDWASGLNVYTLDLDTLTNAVFPLLDERWRIHFAREVGVELDERQNQPARKHWFQLLAGEKH